MVPRCNLNIASTERVDQAARCDGQRIKWHIANIYERNVHWINAIASTQEKRRVNTIPAEQKLAENKKLWESMALDAGGFPSCIQRYHNEWCTLTHARECPVSEKRNSSHCLLSTRRIKKTKFTSIVVVICGYLLLWLSTFVCLRLVFVSQFSP